MACAWGITSLWNMFKLNDFPIKCIWHIPGEIQEDRLSKSSPLGQWEAEMTVPPTNLVIWKCCHKQADQYLPSSDISHADFANPLVYENTKQNVQKMGDL